MSDIWDQAQLGLQKVVEPWDYVQWIEPIRCSEIDESRLEIVLSVPEPSHGKWLEDHFAAFIHQQLKKLTQKSFNIRYVSERGFESEGAHEKPVLPGHPRQESLLSEDDSPGLREAVSGQGLDFSGARREDARKNLIPQYRFDNFVNGPTNQFAMTAAKAVAEAPGKRYNPLFIFGGVGLGKTHLLHAIGHAVLDHSPHLQVRYVTSEVFLNDFIHAIRSDSGQSFRRKYRDECDLLLVDDVQFIAGKERTQEEFFHLFNTLHGSGKQMVFTSDQLPQSIPDIEDRLKSRLQWGLITDVKPPDFETRIAILKAKSESEGFDLPDDVAMLLAEHITRNVRELEGALKHLLASAQMMNRPIGKDLALQVLGHVMGDFQLQMSTDDIMKAVASSFKVSISELKGPRRHRSITVPRQIAMYLMRKWTDESLPQIGKCFGGRDHSTVVNAIKRVEALIDGNAQIRLQIEQISSSLR